MKIKNEFDNFLSSEIKEAIQISADSAENYGVDIFLIGGIVRDLIMKNPIKDIDIAVQSDAIKYAEYLVQKTGCEIVSVQEKLKTAKVRFTSGIEIDFASTREESYLDSGVLPVAGNFGCDLAVDVKRRDFTINTLAIKLTGCDKYALIDYYNGYGDIINKQIKVLHDASFKDDPSRIIRALKFKKRFDFKLDEHTFNLMREYLQNVNLNMPLERIKNELRQYFSVKKDNLYKEIINSGAYKLISNNPVLEVDESRIKDILSFGLYDESEFWFLMICCLIINSDFPVERMNMTAFENKVIAETKELLEEKNIKINDNERIYKLYNSKIDLSIALFYILSGENSVIKFLTALKQIKVLITGKELIDMGFIPSAYFSELFDKVLKEKLKGKLKTKEDEIKFVQKFLKKQSR